MIIAFDNKWGFVDKGGNIVIEPQFVSVGDFKEGLASVQVGDKWGFIDYTGKIVIKTQFDDATKFSDGLASAN